MYFMGIDIGSLSCDAVIIDGDSEIAGWAVVPTGAKNLEAINRARGEAVKKAGIAESDLAAIVSTGYGRDRVDSRLASVTEITCHAKGINRYFPETDILIDIGGQDSKAILLDRKGRVVEFAMNDKCAAGTGRFLEAMARALEVDVDRLGSLDTLAEGKRTLSSMCTVFAESEVVSLVADGAEVHEIIHALHKAIASRVDALVRRIVSDLSDKSIAMSGGVARNKGVVRALEAATGRKINVPPEPDIIGAIGAALIARDRAN